MLQVAEEVLENNGDRCQVIQCTIRGARCSRPTGSAIQRAALIGSLLPRPIHRATHGLRVIPTYLSPACAERACSAGGFA